MTLFQQIKTAIENKSQNQTPSPVPTQVELPPVIDAPIKPTAQFNNGKMLNDNIITTPQIKQAFISEFIKAAQIYELPEKEYEDFLKKISPE